MIQSYLTGRYQKLLIDIINEYDSVSSSWKILELGFSDFELGFIISSYF